MGTAGTLVGHGFSAVLAETFTTGTLVGKPGTIVGRSFQAIIRYYAEMTFGEAIVGAEADIPVRPLGSRLTGLRSRCPLARGRTEKKLLL